MPRRLTTLFGASLLVIGAGAAQAQTDTPPGVEYQPIENPEAARRLLNDLAQYGFVEYRDFSRVNESYFIDAVTAAGDVVTFELDPSTGTLTVVEGILPEPQQQARQGQAGGIMDQELRREIELTEWDYQALYETGWSASQMIGTAVVGGGGEELGEVSNIIVGPDDTANAIIVEAGGFLDIGSTYLSVPWQQVEWMPGAQQAQVPVMEENVADFGLFGEQVAVGADSWRVTNLIGDYVSLQDRPGYGVVEDVIFDQNGAIQAVVVQPDIEVGERRGPVALPFAREGMGRQAAMPEDEPGMSAGWASAQSGEQWYGVPYSWQEVQELEAFETEQMQR